jgi:phosphoglycolate phosphatase-like HAD superfamily hydrolase
MTSLKDYRAYIFDFDGVIANSNELKTAAFYRVAEKFFGSHAARDLVDHHLKNGGITRKEKFRWLVKKQREGGGTEEIGESLVEELSASFAARFRSHLKHIDLVPGVKKFITSLPESVEKIVVTGGDTLETKEILALHHIVDEFDEVRGGPTSKAEHMQALAQRGDDFFHAAVAFGDSLMDFQLATLHGLDFVFVSRFSEWAEGAEKCPIKILDFTDHQIRLLDRDF